MDTNNDKNKLNPDNNLNSSRKVDIFEDEKKLVLDDEHDGILELDNKMPTWWTYMFIICVIFGYVYIAHYHYFGTGKLSIAEYEADETVALAEIAIVRQKLYATITPETVTAVQEPQRLANGKKLFGEKCASCHGANGEGGVGANLSDNTWLYGCKIGDVYKLITEGSPNKTKGMVPWKSQLNPVQIQDIASYILTLPPATGKAAEGMACAK
jgi:cytochrome c oxidase cbb3-type subunit III